MCFRTFACPRQRDLQGNDTVPLGGIVSEVHILTMGQYTLWGYIVQRGRKKFRQGIMTGDWSDLSGITHNNLENVEKSDRVVARGA